MAGRDRRQCRLVMTFQKAQKRFNELMDRSHEIDLIILLDDPDPAELEKLKHEETEIKRELMEYGLSF